MHHCNMVSQLASNAQHSQLSERTISCGSKSSSCRYCGLMQSSQHCTHTIWMAVPHAPWLQIKITLVIYKRREHPVAYIGNLRNTINYKLQSDTSRCVLHFNSIINTLENTAHVVENRHIGNLICASLGFSGVAPIQSWKTTTANLYIYLYKVIGQISHFFWPFHIFCISLPYFNLCMDSSWQAVYTLPLHYLIKAGLCCPSSSFAGGLAHLADIFHTCGYCAALLHHLLWLNEPFCQGA